MPGLFSASKTQAAERPDIKACLEAYDKACKHFLKKEQERKFHDLLAAMQLPDAMSISRDEDRVRSASTAKSASTADEISSAFLPIINPLLKNALNQGAPLCCVLTIYTFVFSLGENSLTDNHIEAIDNALDAATTERIYTEQFIAATETLCHIRKMRGLKDQPETTPDYSDESSEDGTNWDDDREESSSTSRFLYENGSTIEHKALGLAELTETSLPEKHSQLAFLCREAYLSYSSQIKYEESYCPTFFYRLYRDHTNHGKRNAEEFTRSFEGFAAKAIENNHSAYELAFALLHFFKHGSGGWKPNSFKTILLETILHGVNSGSAPQLSQKKISNVMSKRKGRNRMLTHLENTLLLSLHSELRSQATSKSAYDAASDKAIELKNTYCRAISSPNESRVIQPQT